MDTLQIISRAGARAAGYKRYFTGVPCLNGHVTERRLANGACLACDRDLQAKVHAADPEKKRARDRAIRLKDPEKARAKDKARREANLAKRRSQQRDGYKRNAAKYNAARRAKHAADPDHRNAMERARRKADPVYTFNRRARCLIRASLTSKGFKKNSKTEVILGCSLYEFRRQIERQFLPGMSWANMSEWDIDHIIPAASASSQLDAEALNRAGNLRPLWRDANRAKGDLLLFLL